MERNSSNLFFIAPQDQVQNEKLYPLVQSVIGQKLTASHQNEQAAKMIDGWAKLKYKLTNAIKRVIWELMQNAQDSAQGLNRGVEIEIKIQDDQFSFSHSGRPFNLDDLLHLIIQTSFKERKKLDLTFQEILDSKGDAPKETGQFGTGFLTTHLLSKVVTLDCIFERPKGGTRNAPQYQRFNLKLDRSPNTKAEFIEKYKEAFDSIMQLDDISKFPLIEDFDPDHLGVMSTTFIYPIEEDDENKKSLINECLINFKNCIGYVLAFNPKILSVRLIDEREGSTSDIKYQISSTEALSQSIDLVKIDMGGETMNLILTSLKKWINLAIEVQINEETGKFEICQRIKDQDFLFTDFPMIGSYKDQFFPCAVNCHLFQPDEERSTIMMHSSDDAAFNFEILTEASKLYTLLIVEAETKGWTQIERLCKIKFPDQLADKENKDPQYLTKKSEYNQLIFIPMFQAVLELNIIKNMKGENIKVKDAWFPKISEHDLLDKEQGENAQIALLQLYQYVGYQNVLPLNDETYLRTWLEIISVIQKSIKDIKDDEQPSFFEFNLFNVFYRIDPPLDEDSEEDEEAKQEKIAIQQQISIEFLNSLYKFMVEFLRLNVRKEIVAERKIFKNQANQMCKYHGLKCEGDQIPEIYKTLCKTYLKQDLKMTLIDAESDLQGLIDPPKRWFREIEQDLVNQVNKGSIDLACEIAKAEANLEVYTEQQVSQRNTVIIVCECIIPVLRKVEGKKDQKFNIYPEKLYEAAYYLIMNTVKYYIVRCKDLHELSKAISIQEKFCDAKQWLITAIKLMVNQKINISKQEWYSMIPGQNGKMRHFEEIDKNIKYQDFKIDSINDLKVFKNSDYSQHVKSLCFKDCASEVKNLQLVDIDFNELLKDQSCIPSFAAQDALAIIDNIASKISENTLNIQQNKEFLQKVIQLGRDGFCDQKFAEKYLPEFHKVLGIVQAIFSADKISLVLNNLFKQLGSEGSEEFMNDLQNANKQKLDVIKGILKF